MRSRRTSTNPSHLEYFYSLANIDSSLLNFLKQYFPAESKAKQRSNTRAAELDYGSSGCTLM